MKIVGPRPVDAGAGHCDREANAEGTCALCGADGPGVAIADVLSENFLNADRLPFRSRHPSVLCLPCAWSFRDRRLRQSPTETTPAGLRVLSPSELLGALSRPVDGHRAVCVPILGRKHLYPWIRWGTVLSDHGDRPWVEAECALLRSVAELRAMGFGEAALREDQPRWVVMSKVPDPAAVLDAWDRLLPWRQDQTIEIAIKATRKDKETRADDAADD